MIDTQMPSTPCATSQDGISTRLRGIMGDYSDISPITQPRGTFISLYAGAGGLDIGFMLAGFVPLWVSELDPLAMRTHELAYEQLSATHPHLATAHHSIHIGDVLAIAEEELPTRHMADLVIGGPPCTSFIFSTWWSVSIHARL